MKPELYIGRSVRQVEVYLRDVVYPALSDREQLRGVTAEIKV
jgi:adenylosuccinate lyase